MFPYTIERAKTAVDQVGRTVRQMMYFLTSRTRWCLQTNLHLFGGLGLLYNKFGGYY